MSETNNIILYVQDVDASVRFYAGTLELETLQSVPGFALLALPSGLNLGLWKRDAVQPAAAAAPGGSEIGFKVDDAETVDALFRTWSDKGVAIALPPTDLGFGRSFVGTDPDGHRLRVYAPANAA